MFCRRIVGHVTTAAQAQHRADQDDRTAAASHMWQCRFDGVPNAGEVDIQHRLPCRLLDQRGWGWGTADAGIRHDYVERAERGHSLLKRCTKTVEVPHIGLRADDAAARL